MGEEAAAGVGEVLRRARRARNLSQAEVAGGICSVSYLSLIESGKRNPDDRVLQQLLARLDLEPTERDGVAGAIDPLAAVEVALRLGDGDTAEGYLQHVPASPRSRLLRGLLLEFRGDLTGALDILGPIVDDARTPSNVGLQARIALCRCLLNTGQIESARNMGELALAGAVRGSSDWDSEIVELRSTLAGIYCETGDLFRARQLTADPPEHAHETPWQRAARDWSRALVSNAAGDFVNAGQHARSALRRLRDLDKPRSEANLLHTAVWVELQSGTYEPHKCREDLHRAEQILRTMNTDVELAMCLSTHAEFESLQGNPQRAHQLTTEALSLVPREAAGVRARLLVGAATCAIRENDPAQGKQYLLEARTSLENSGATHSAAICWRQMGALYEDLDELDLALACIKAATDLVGLGAHVIHPARVPLERL